MQTHLTTEQQNRYCSGALSDEVELHDVDAHMASCPSCREALFHALRDNAGTLRRSLLPARDEPHCLDDEVISQYIQDKLEPIDREIVEAHLSLCPRCTEDVASLKAFHEHMLRFDWNSLPRESLREKLSRLFTFHDFGTLPKFHQVLAWWEHFTLSGRILSAVVIGLILGILLGPQASALEPVGSIVLTLLGALATPLIFVAIIQALLIANMDGKTARKLIVLLLTNTLVAILVGLTVITLFKPGRGVSIANLSLSPNAVSLRSLAHQMPPSILAAISENKIVYVILAAIAIGIALRSVRATQQSEGSNAYRAVEDLTSTALLTLTKMIQWAIALVPFAICAIVANLVGNKDYAMARSLGGFVGAVLLALTIQAIYYLIRLRLGSWVTPSHFLRSGRSAFLMAFSTASSAATMPVTYRCMRERTGVGEKAASMGVLLGGSLNRDGTALYQTMASVFIAQLTGVPIALPRQLIVILTSVMASVGAPGIPEAGMITMLMIFRSLGLREEYIGVLLAVDWFLDRCRTAVNVMGHTSVTCILDGKVRPAPLLIAEPITAANP